VGSSGEPRPESRRARAPRAHAGFRKTIKHLDGHEVVLQSSGITKPGDYHYLKGEGMPIHNQEPARGDLFVMYSVAFPTALSDGEKAQIRELLKNTDMPVPPAA
jgi:DnaJ homolog subfamily B member 11